MIDLAASWSPLSHCVSGCMHQWWSEKAANICVLRSGPRCQSKSPKCAKMIAEGKGNLGCLVEMGEVECGCAPRSAVAPRRL